MIVSFHSGEISNDPVILLQHSSQTLFLVAELVSCGEPVTVHQHLSPSSSTLTVAPPCCGTRRCAATDYRGAAGCQSIHPCGRAAEISRKDRWRRERSFNLRLLLQFSRSPSKTGNPPVWIYALWGRFYLLFPIFRWDL